ncbi:MAG: transporter [Syntrophotaleaceae bacterium]
MGTIKNKALCLVLVAAFLLVGGFVNVKKASAVEAIIPYSVIGTNEYNLPVGFDEPINLLLSYNVWTNIDQSYDANGDEQSSGYDLLASVNKFARLFTIDGLDNWGFLWEGVLSFGSLTTESGDHYTGLLDPQTGVVAWTKPIPSWTTCFEYWMYLPFGDDSLTGGSLNHAVTWMNNHQLFDGKIVVDWDLGYKIRGDARVGGVKSEQGNSLFTNWVVTYKHNAYFNPNFHFDYEASESGKNKNTGATIASGENMQIGIGNSMKLTDRLLFDVWYARGIDGRNAPKSNNIFTRFIWSF